MTALPEGHVIDPATAEVVPSSLLATVYANGTEELADLLAEVTRIRAELAEMAEALRPAAEAGPIDAGQGRKVVLVPEKRRPQRVNAAGCAKYQEKLADIGVGHYEEVRRFVPPGIKEVRDRAAELVAHGIPVEEIAPTPIEGPGSLEVVSL